MSASHINCFCRSVGTVVMTVRIVVTAIRWVSHGTWLMPRSTDTCRTLGLLRTFVLLRIHYGPELGGYDNSAIYDGL
jgi:hypothetical protein